MDGVGIAEASGTFTVAAMIWALTIALAYLVSWAAIPHLLLQHKRPLASLSWLLGLFLLPFPVLPLYLFIGTDRLRRQRLARRPPPDHHGEPVTVTSEKDPCMASLAALAEHPWAKLENPRFFSKGAAFYEDLLEKIESARERIWIQFYIWKPDERGRLMLARLVQAARRGVEVRLLVDELGSVETKESFFKPLREAGGHFSWFYTVHPRRNRFFFSLRNHRKIACFDGAVGYIGGMNVGLEYEGKDRETGEWLDLHLRGEGTVLEQLETVFAEDWYFATTERIRVRAGSGADVGGGFPALVVESGPDERYERNHLALGAVIGAARERLDLFTPYFIPTTELIHHLALAALRGLRVRLVICQTSDIRMLIDIGRSYYRGLIMHGVEIFEYTAGVHHAKALRMDEDWFMIGSTNLDVRSLRLNFEANLYGRDAGFRAELDPHLDSIFEHCERIRPEDLEDLPLGRRLREGALRLLAPIL
ncbi:MAG: hypothetical protein EA425_01755 [Puniceicoccaceae bacterium]|nr:MAG: hypothetical protein EA425_01755 [Puniceicoccaceae bacterium]